MTNLKSCHSMYRPTLFMVMMLSSIISNSQSISVTFTGTGAASLIDSVKATNLATNQSVTLPGNETLILADHSGIPDDTKLTSSGIVFPNPFSGNTTVSISVQNAQSVYLKVINQVGQEVI
ncbi:MAG: hypothetical protein A2X22_03205 [Bacteroidetes bacterium GWF2_49_14]|nr:MAG: hypothetical protein A2X22_03205 [Bacteroidetes bacterium GWF2_49_14]